MKNILIFSDAYSKKNGLKSKILLNDNNFDKLIDTFFMSYELMESAYVTKIQQYFQETSYYVHAQYFILYLLKKEFPNNYKYLDENMLSTVKKIIDENISKESKIKGNEYSHNNYFKSYKPQLDYLEDKKEAILSVDERLQKLFP